MNLEELDISKTNSRKSLIVLEALLNGHIIEIDGNRYVMGKTTNAGFKLCLIAKENNNNIILGADIPIGNFITLCEKMEDDEIAIISSNLVLNKI